MTISTRNRAYALVLAVAVVAATATTANAEFLEIHANNLGVAWDGISSLLMSAADSTIPNGNATNMDVIREVAPTGTAVFEPGFFGVGSADIVYDLTLDSRGTLGGIYDTARFLGTVTVTDVDGDTITGSVDITFLDSGGLSPVIVFSSVSGITFSDTSSGATFDGASATEANGTFISTELPASFALPLIGAISFISVDVPFFEDGAAFDPSQATATAQIIPAPAAWALGAVGLGMIGWLKRRRVV